MLPTSQAPAWVWGGIYIRIVDRRTPIPIFLQMIPISMGKKICKKNTHLIKITPLIFSGCPLECELRAMVQNRGAWSWALLWVAECPVFSHAALPARPAPRPTHFNPAGRAGSLSSQGHKPATFASLRVTSLLFSGHTAPHAPHAPPRFNLPSHIAFQRGVSH